jgi:hypothetical protein
MDLGSGPVCRHERVLSFPGAADGLGVLIMPRCGLIVDGAELSAVAVSTARGVPGFDPVEGRVGELVAGVPVVLVE